MTQGHTALLADEFAALPAATAPCTVVRMHAGHGDHHESQDVLAEETPVALSYNGISHATMLVTPAELEDFAVGFSLTEGIVDHVRDIRDIRLDVQSQGVVVELDIAGAPMDRLKQRRRAMAGRTGCGLCGVETLPEVLRDVAPVEAGKHWPALLLADGMRAMRAQQTLHSQTGATHAAAWMDGHGVVRCVREDVGRHNALDKLLGALARDGIDAAAGAVLVSSRASFEMVQKAASQGATLLAAVSAPTALACRVAHASNVTLLGFFREANFSIYSHPQRVVT